MLQDLIERGNPLLSQATFLKKAIPEIEVEEVRKR